MTLKALALNCSLKSDPDENSSTDAMILVLGKALAKNNVTLTRSIRVASLNVKPGVTSDEGEGDDFRDYRMSTAPIADWLILFRKPE